MIDIKEYEPKDIKKISKMIIRNLIEINAKKMAKDFEPQKLKETFKNRKKVYVAIEDGEIVGTAGADTSWYNKDELYILTVFVKPEKHGYGIGKALIGKIEKYAKSQQVKKLIVPASITGHEFYYKLGYRYKNGKKKLNEENIYMMEKLNK